MDILNKRLMPRRTFLRAAGVSLGLPLLDAMTPLAIAAEAPPKRMVLIGRGLGMLPANFFPDAPGKEYEPSRYLKLLAPLKDQFTVFSGVSHAGYAGHGSSIGLFTGVEWARIKNNVDTKNTVSLDQLVAEQVGNQTRFSSLTLGGASQLSWNRRGQCVPPETSPATVFRHLFLDGSAAEIANEVRKLEDGRSILDEVRDQTKALGQTLGAADRDRLDLFLSSVREAETHLRQNEAWVKQPKPKVALKAPVELMSAAALTERERQWYDLLHLAVQTDSTRVISLWLYSHGKTDVPGVTIDHHDASHHGMDPAKLEQLAKIEELEMKLFAEFLTKLSTSKEAGGSLLDRTSVCLGSNLGNASAHTGSNLPILLAGGGFRHAGHVAFDRKSNKPLSNLYLRMLHQMGLESKAFGMGTAPLTELG